MITDNEQDELIFDFLEGNLSPDEEAAFRILIEESELLNRKIRLWQNAYFKDPLPSIEPLEKKLFIHRDSGNFSTLIYSLFIGILMLMMLQGEKVEKYNQGSQNEFDHPRSVIQNAVTIQTNAESLKLLTDCNEKINPTSQHTIKQNVDAPPDDYSSTSESHTLSDLKTDAVLWKPHEITLLKVKIRKTEIKKSDSAAVDKKWSRRELRLLHKKLWQDHRTRKINEFRSGNEPYVIPMNSNNF